MGQIYGHIRLQLHCIAEYIVMQALQKTPFLAQVALVVIPSTVSVILLRTILAGVDKTFWEMFGFHVALDI